MMTYYHVNNLKLRSLASLFWVAMILSSCASIGSVKEQNLASSTVSGHINNLPNESHLQLAQQAFLGHDYHTAKGLFEQTLATQPSADISLAAQYGLAASADMLNDFKLSENIYQTLALSQNKTSTWLNNYGYSKLLQGHFTEAHALFTKAIEIDPNNQHSKANLLMLRNTLQNALQGTE